MSRQVVDDVFNHGVHRMLADGIHYRDLRDIQASIADPSQWCQGWVRAAEQHVELADKALARGHTLTAGEALWRAALYCHYGQGNLCSDLEDKRRAQQRKEELFRRAAPLLAPPLEHVEIPFETTTMPGYLRLPAGVARPPCAILLGGLDTTKEDYTTFNTLCVQRGLATLAFDGPGQGEMFYRMTWRQDFEKAIFAVLDYLGGRSEVDAGRIGIIGRSTGGHYAPRAAAMDGRLKAVVAWGAMYHMRNIRTMPPIIREGFVFASGSSSLEEAARFYSTVDLSGVASKITCPLLVVHGGQDTITPTENATMLAREAAGPVEMLFWEDSIHCCHDRSHIVRPAMADFLARHLGATSALGAVA